MKSTKEEIKELKRLRSKLPKPPTDLLDKHKELLRACDSEMLAKLMKLPEQLLKRALSKPLSFRALADAQAALAVAIPLLCALAGHQPRRPDIRNIDLPAEGHGCRAPLL